MKATHKSVFCATLIASTIVGAAAITYRNELPWLIKRLPIIRRYFAPTVDGQIKTYGTPARARIAGTFSKAKFPYPPDQVIFLAIKATRILDIYCSSANSPFQYICTYPILGASGHLGPKLRSGDRQVPEGIYNLSLEPNTPYHLALRLNYPNEDDIERAKADGRTNPGSDILIHGTTGSVGCIAVGDQASEDLFVLVHDTRVKNPQLIIAPVDFRTESAPATKTDDPPWLPALYAQIRAAMAKLPAVAPSPDRTAEHQINN